MLCGGALLGIALSAEVLIKGLPDRHREAIGEVHHLLLEEVRTGGFVAGTLGKEGRLLFP